MSLPEAFLARLDALLGPGGRQAHLEAIAAPRAMALVVTPELGDPGTAAATLAAAGVEVRPIAWHPRALLVPSGGREALLRHPWTQARRIHPVNPTSLIAPSALAPRPGERVLDLAAAPGGKTVALARAMEGEGELWAVEAVRGRFHKLRATLAAQGLGWVRTRLGDGRRLPAAWSERFDRVLLDAPCSAEAHLRPEAPAASFWSERKIAEQARKQRGLIAAAVRCLRPGGRLVYATCTLAPEENEAVVAWALARFGGALRVVPFRPPAPAWREGITAWRGRTWPAAVAAARRVLAAEGWEPGFVCVLEKTATTRLSHGRSGRARSRAAAG